jgi:hypothetical protein
MRNMVAIPLLLVVPLAGQAQQLPTFISSAGSDTAPAAPAAAFGHPDDYCLEGLIAGAVLVGGAFTAIIIGLCPYSDSCETGDALLVSLGRSHSAVSPAPSSAAQYRKPHQPPHLRHRCCSRRQTRASSWRAGAGRPSRSHGRFRGDVIATRCCWRVVTRCRIVNRWAAS